MFNLMKAMLLEWSRYIIGLLALVAMAVGAGILWGWGGALFAGGLFILIDLSCDDVIQCIIDVKCGFPESEETS